MTKKDVVININKIVSKTNVVFKGYICNGKIIPKTGIDKNIIASLMRQLETLIKLSNK